MTIVAGYFCISDAVDVPPTMEQEVRSALRRVHDSRGHLTVARRAGFYLCKWDSGAFGEPAWQESEQGGISTLVGDPLFSDTGERQHRSNQLECLNLFLDGIDQKLARTRGSFSLICYSEERRELRIATDILGVRSLYYTVQNGLLIFASAIRILEAIPSIKRRISIIGTAEQCIYGQPLGERSPYEEISILREAERLTAGKGKLTVTNYFNWSQSSTYVGTEEQAAEQLYRHFLDGVKLRALPGERAIAFLSGGMDSRAIVATLMAAGHPVVALNFSPEGSQDKDYAEQFAEAAGPNCLLYCQRVEDPNFSLLAAKTKDSLERGSLAGVQRPNVVWSGDGGSVGLGHVYMDEKMVDVIESDGIEKAAEYFMALHRNQLPVGVLEAPWRKHLPEEIYRNVLAEIGRYPCTDIGRQLYLFLLINDQRRHLYVHLESIDEHGLEFLTPFFDSVFLRAVAATPVRWGLLHRLYARWFTHLPKFAQTTPWQTYPGHVECPIKCQKDLSYQWSGTVTRSSGPVTERLPLAWQLAKSSCAPQSCNLFSRTRTLSLALLELFGMRNSQHALRTIQTFRTILARTN